MASGLGKPFGVLRAAAEPASLHADAAVNVSPNTTVCVCCGRYQIDRHAHFSMEDHVCMHTHEVSTLHHIRTVYTYTKMVT